MGAVSPMAVAEKDILTSGSQRKNRNIFKSFIQTPVAAHDTPRFMPVWFRLCNENVSGSAVAAAYAGRQTAHNNTDTEVCRRCFEKAL